MHYVNKHTAEKIPRSVYIQLSEEGKSNFIALVEQNNVTINSSETTDLLGLGKAVETVVVTPLAVGLGILNKIF